MKVFLSLLFVYFWTPFSVGKLWRSFEGEDSSVHAIANYCFQAKAFLCHVCSVSRDQTSSVLFLWAACCDVRTSCKIICFRWFLYFNQIFKVLPDVGIYFVTVYCTCLFTDKLVRPASSSLSVNMWLSLDFQKFWLGLLDSYCWYSQWIQVSNFLRGVQ